MRRVVAIFRRELRLTDNPLLEGAEDVQFIPVFFLDAYNQEEHGDNLRALFFHALRQLRAGIEGLGGKLYVVCSGDQETFFDIAQPDEVRFCEDVEPHSRERDAQLQALLNRKGIRVRVLRDSLLSPLPNVTYPSFTQFYRRHFTQHVQPGSFIPVPQSLQTPLLDVPETPLPQVDTAPARRWYSTEQEVQERWQEFVVRALSRYSTQRNLPAVPGVSHMSPYIRCGLVSLRQMLRDSWGVSEQFVKELAWRDFYSHLLYHHPHTPQTELREDWRGFPWRNDESDFERWTQGKTGVPLVDAGMRQLLQEGWIHNRVRMVVASYLTKHLLIDWRWGERWFYQNLVDADLAMNVGNWQWTAGCGADALPYFRIFNPILQAQKFDPEGHYIRQYVPELYGATSNDLLDISSLHRRFADYPPPLVGLEEGRARFLQVAQRHFGSSSQMPELPLDG